MVHQLAFILFLGVCSTLVWGQPQPQVQPDVQPQVQPDVQPQIQPDVQPQVQPDVQPQVQPDVQPDVQPSLQPDVQPSVQPSVEPSPGPVPVPSPYNPNATIQGYITIGTTVAAIIVGVFWVFMSTIANFKLFRLAAFLAGFVVFYYVAYKLLSTLVNLQSLPFWADYAIGAGAGIAGGLIFCIQKNIGQFLFGFLAGTTVGVAVFAGTPLSGISVLLSLYQLLAIIGLGLVVGLVTAFLPLFVKVSAAFTGAGLIALVVDFTWINVGIAAYVEQFFEHPLMQPCTYHLDPSWKLYVTIGAVVVLATIGIVVQFILRGKEEEENPLINEVKETTPLRSSKIFQL